MSSSQKRRLLTGLQSSGTLHIGNYFGALKPFLDIYQDYDSMLMVADYHAITSLRDGEQLRRNTIEVIKDYLACGIDPNKAIIFKQSDIAEHMELAWVLSSVMPMKYLELAHAYKDKVAKGIDANVGLFTYPILMAADILLYDTEVVPVGEDQRQHIEYTREAAKKFNLAYGVALTMNAGNEELVLPRLGENAVLVEPQEMILKSTGVIPGTDGKKMSKSYGNTIPLFGTKDEITKAVKGIVTDSKGDWPHNVFNIHRFVRRALYPNEKLVSVSANMAPVYSPELEYVDERDPMSVGMESEFLINLYINNLGRYGALKEALISDLDAFIAPMREKRNGISDEHVMEILEKGNARARERAQNKMKAVRDLIGINLKISK